MNTKKIFTLILLLILIIFLSFYIAKSAALLTKNDANKIGHVEILNTLIKVNLATTKSEQEQGLSERKSINDDEGMLFIFQKPSVNYFWMKDMKFPIDIIWIGDNSEIIYIKKNVNPDTYPTTFGPNEESRYVLEVNAGFSEKNNWIEKNSVIFLP